MTSHHQKSFRPAILKHLPRLIGVLAVLAISSCSTTISGVSPETLNQRGLKPGEGLIVGSYESVCIDRSHKSTQSMVMNSFVRASSTDSKGSPKVLINNGTGSNFMNFMNIPAAQPDSSFAIPLPAGNYEIDGWFMTANGYGSTISVKNRLPMKVPFQVRAGEATYIGKVGVVSINGRNFLGLPVFAEGVILIVDQYEKDSGRITNTFPSIKRSQIRRSDVPKLYAEEMKRIINIPRRWWDGLL